MVWDAPSEAVIAALKVLGKAVSSVESERREATRDCLSQACKVEREKAKAAQTAEASCAKTQCETECNKLSAAAQQRAFAENLLSVALPTLKSLIEPWNPSPCLGFLSFRCCKRHHWLFSPCNARPLRASAAQYSKPSAFPLARTGSSSSVPRETELKSYRYSTVNSSKLE